jgi:hypothetical protein
MEMRFIRTEKMLGFRFRFDASCYKQFSNKRVYVHGMNKLKLKCFIAFANVPSSLGLEHNSPP